MLLYSIKINSKEQLQAILNEKQNSYLDSSFSTDQMKVGSGYNYDARKVSNVTPVQIDSILKGKLNGYGKKYYEVGHKYGIDPAF